MIFFLTQDGKTDYTFVTNPDVTNQYPKWGNNSKVVAWNEVYPWDSSLTKPSNFNDLAKDKKELQTYLKKLLNPLLTAIMAAANSDDICKELCAQAKSLFGLQLDYFLSGNLFDSGVSNDANNVSVEQIQAIVLDTLQDWAHPAIGNMSNSPKVRPATRQEQYVTNWDSCQFLDSNTKDSIDKLFEYMPPLSKSSRDQVRICHNIVDLARAFLGEVTCYVSRRLEKMLALQLCNSQKLHDKQKEMINKFLNDKKPYLERLVKNHTATNDMWHFFEYLFYYLPNNVKDLNGDQLWDLIETLIDGATNDNVQTDQQNDIIKNSNIIWKTIPKTVRCAILMNDFRSIWMKNSSKDFIKQFNINLNNPDKFSMVFDKLPGDTSFVKEYKIDKAADQSHVPKFQTVEGRNRKNTSWSKAWSWNRHERHAATITYRYFLCPLWAGPSGHTGGGLKFWLNLLDTDAPQETSMVVTSGLFTLWRLYYDKRISGFHTMAETYEASCSEDVLQEKVTTTFSQQMDASRKQEIVTATDAMKLVKLASTQSSTNKQDLVDPIKLLEVLKIKYYDPTAGTHSDKIVKLNEQIAAEQKKLTDNGISVIKWTSEISTKQGTDVKNFSKVLEDIKCKALNTEGRLSRSLFKDYDNWQNAGTI